MKIVIKRQDGKIHVMQVIKVGPRFPQNPLRKMRVVDDTPKNYADIVRWIDAVGHTLEDG